MSCRGQLHILYKQLQQRACSSGAADGHEQPIATFEGQHVPAELANTGHPAPWTETPHEAFGAESLPRHKDDDNRGMRKEEHVHLFTVPFIVHANILLLFQQTYSALCPLCKDVNALEEEGDRPVEEGGGQEGGQRQPEQLDKQGQVVLALSHQPTV